MTALLKESFEIHSTNRSICW